jgi:hypothetical protein
MAAQYPDRFRVGTVDAASFDVVNGRNDEVTIQVLEWDRRVVPASAQGPFKIVGTLRDAEYGTDPVIERDLIQRDPKDGTWSLVLLTDDFDEVPWPLTDRYRTLWLDLIAHVTDPDTETVHLIPVMDPTARSQFPFRIHRLVGSSA